MTAASDTCRTEVVLVRGRGQAVLTLLPVLETLPSPLPTTEEQMLPGVSRQPPVPSLDLHRAFLSFIVVITTVIIIVLFLLFFLHLFL